MVDVWAGNARATMLEIASFLDDYPCVAMDTEFPGVVLRTVPRQFASHEHAYDSVKLNVDSLSLIQVGLTFFDRQGRPRPGRCTFQFNLRFDLERELFAPDSIALLREAGIDFQRCAREGIPAEELAELFLTSGLVLNHRVHWIVFHGAYDQAYLLKLLSAQNLPDQLSEFRESCLLYFPHTSDLKCLTSGLIHGGLDAVAQQLRVKRTGSAHQAGSDSRVTGDAFFALERACNDESEASSRPPWYTHVRQRRDLVCNSIYGLRSENTRPELQQT
ncbi:MAG: hypothetical protein MHM6MM_002114 [Cercozoa sp. M6MM]